MDLNVEVLRLDYWVGYRIDWNVRVDVPFKARGSGRCEFGAKSMLWGWSIVPLCSRDHLILILITVAKIIILEEPISSSIAFLLNIETPSPWSTRSFLSLLLLFNFLHLLGDIAQKRFWKLPPHPLYLDSQFLFLLIGSQLFILFFLHFLVNLLTDVSSYSYLLIPNVFRLSTWPVVHAFEGVVLRVLHF